MKQKPKHILFSVAWYPNQSGKLCSPFVKGHAEAISQYCKLSVLGVFSSAQHKHIHIERRQVNSQLSEYLVYTPEFRVADAFGWKLVAGIYYYIAYFLGLAKILKHEGPISGIHVNVLTRAGLIPMMIKILFKKPYIISEHWSRYYSSEKFKPSGLHYRLTKAIVKQAAAVYVASGPLKAAMQKAGLSNQHYHGFRNVVDTSLFKPQSPPSHKVKHFTTLAFFKDEVKNQSGILRVLARLQKDGLAFHYTFIGDGQDLERIKALSASYGLDDKLVFKGRLNAAEIAAELQQTDVSILFSNYESQPVSIIESLACGTPVVATKVGDIPKMIPEACGELIPPQDEEALYQCMVKIINGQSRYAREKCLEAARKYSYSKVGKAFADSYKDYGLA